MLKVHFIDNKEEGRSEVLLGPDNNIDFFKHFDKVLIKLQMTKTSPDNHLNYIDFLKHFYEVHTKKIKYRAVTCLILKL